MRTGHRTDRPVRRRRVVFFQHAERLIRRKLVHGSRDVTATRLDDFSLRQELLMNKSDLVKGLAKEMDLPMRKAEEIVDMVFKTMTNALVEGDRIEIRGFGSFVVKEYEGYVGRNPKTGAKITVQSKYLPFFKTGKELRDSINETKPLRIVSVK